MNSKENKIKLLNDKDIKRIINNFTKVITELSIKSVYDYIEIYFTNSNLINNLFSFFK